MKAPVVSLPDVPRRPVVVAPDIPCRDAADAFIVARLPLAARVAYHFAHDDEQWSECFQDASLGLVELVRRVLPDLLATSATHAEALAVLAMRHSIVVALARHAALLPSLTDFGVRRWVQVQRVRRLLARRLGRDATPEEIAAALGITPALVRDLLAVTTRPDSLEALATQGLDVSDTNDTMPREDDLRMRRAVMCLPQPERFIIQAQFGIGMGRVSILNLAHTLVMSPRTVIAHRRRALTQLRTLLTEE